MTMALETLTTISPITNEPILTRTGVSSEELAVIPEIAQEAFRSFSQSTTLAQRQEIVARALGILAKKKDELARELTTQMGRPIAYTPAEIATAVKRGEFLNRVSSEVLGEDGVTKGEPEKGFNRFIKRKPVGVVLIIFAWNVCPLKTWVVGCNSTTQRLMGVLLVSVSYSSQQLDPGDSCWECCDLEAVAADAYCCRTDGCCFY